jgi:hypothetical protein
MDRPEKVCLNQNGVRPREGYLMLGRPINPLGDAFRIPEREPEL